MSRLKSFFTKNYLVFVFLIAFAATMGSLVFSEIYHLDPCKLCWYQRIFMYPLTILTAISIIFRVPLRKIYILALSIPGMLIGFYQYYLQMTQGGSDVNTCGSGVSCNFIDFKFAGFITIPFLSFAAFLLINMIVIAVYLIQKRSAKHDIAG